MCRRTDDARHATKKSRKLLYDSDSDLTTADLNEIVAAERHDTDMLQRQYEAESAAYVRDMEAGICHHSSQIGGGVDFYSADMIAEIVRKREPQLQKPDPFVGAQKDIPEGKSFCCDCGQLVDAR
jgi:hypothetical protein